MLRIVDVLQCDLGDVKPERKERLLKDAALYSTPGEHPVPALIVTVAATHAGLMTRNKAFYRPDVMKTHLDSFLKPFSKPVQIHHSDHSDPVGRVRAARYIDISRRYTDPMQSFRESFGGTTFVDGKSDNEKAFDQVNWILKNFQEMKDYTGLGYGELDLHISDPKAVEKILDERYLTVSVGFSTTEAYCSVCKQDWAGNEGPCEHRPGEVYEDNDNLPMVLIPANFLYEEVSWVNNPADPHAQVIQVTKTGTDVVETVSANEPETRDFYTVPILLGVSGGGIYRLDSYKDVDESRAREILTVAKKQDEKPKEQPKQVELIEFDGSQFPKAVEDLLADDAKRENWITDEMGGHKHRAIIDPATGNGYTDYVDGHSHDVVNKDVREGGKTEWNETEGKSMMIDAHSHSLSEKTDPLTDEADPKEKTEDASGRPVDEGTATPQEDKSKCKRKRKARRRKANMTGAQTVDEEEFEEQEFDKDAELPEGFEWVEEDGDSDDSTEDSNAETELEITDEVIAADNFYDEFIVPELEQLEAADAKLSGEQRKKLKSSTFCGPGRSFPVPDCAHVTAARRLIGRYKGSAATKKRILACVNRKARSLGCGSKKDSFEPIDLSLTNPQDKNKNIEVRISDIEDFKVAIHTLGAEVYEANKDRFHEVGKAFGMEPDQVDGYTNPENEPKDLEAATSELENMASQVDNEQFVDNLVSHIKTLGDDTREEFVRRLYDKLVEAGLLPDHDEEFNALVEENAELKDKLARMTAANRDLYAGKQELLAKTIVQLKESLKKEGFKELDDDARTTRINELKIRSIDSLTDSLTDLSAEISGAKETQPELDEAAVTPGSLEIRDPGENSDDAEPQVTKIDTTHLRNLPDRTYQLARKLQDAYAKDLK